MSNEITPEIREELKNRYEATKASWGGSPTAATTKLGEKESKKQYFLIRGWATFFLIVAVLFGIGGCNVAFIDSKVVGGDAYNYIISAGRGTAVVGIGIIFGLFSIVLALYDLTNVIIHYNKKKE